MLNALRKGALAIAGCAALACSPSKTKAPVETTTDAGKSTSPAGTAAQKRGMTLVRVVNALPGKMKVAVHADDRLLFDHLAYQDVTDYIELKENVAHFTVKPNGKDTVLADNREVMGDGARYTLVALPDGEGGHTLRVLRDELVPDSGKTRIRVINAAPGLQTVKVMVQGQAEPLFSDVALGVEAGYKDVEPTTATLLFQAKPGAPVVRVDRLKLVAGHAYTVVLTGAAGHKVEAVEFDDRLVRSAAQLSQKP